MSHFLSLFPTFLLLVLIDFSLLPLLPLSADGAVTSAFFGTFSAAATGTFFLLIQGGETKCHSPPSQSVINASFAIHPRVDTRETQPRRRWGRNEPARKFSPPPPTLPWWNFLPCCLVRFYCNFMQCNTCRWCPTIYRTAWQQILTVINGNVGVGHGVQVTLYHVTFAHTKWQVLHELRANHKRNGFIR